MKLLSKFATARVSSIEIWAFWMSGVLIGADCARLEHASLAHAIVHWAAALAAGVWLGSLSSRADP